MIGIQPPLSQHTVIAFHGLETPVAHCYNAGGKVSGPQDGQRERKRSGYNDSTLSDSSASQCDMVNYERQYMRASNNQASSQTMELHQTHSIARE